MAYGLVSVDPRTTTPLHVIFFNSVQGLSGTMSIHYLKMRAFYPPELRDHQAPLPRSSSSARASKSSLISVQRPHHIIHISFAF